MGKHVYVEKPLTHSFQEAELLMKAEKKFGVVTQMGNQGHTGTSSNQFREWVKKGVIKNVTEVDAWKGPSCFFMQKDKRINNWPKKEPKPVGMDWDLWLGPAEHHPFSRMYHTFEWRGFHPYGSGMLGDWGCHIIDMIHHYLDLGLPTEINAFLKRELKYIPVVDFMPVATNALSRFVDGGTSGACGNGTRCVADLLSKENNKSLIILTTQSGDLKSEILGDRLVSTEIGKGKTEWNEIPLSKKLDTNNLNIKISDLDNNNYTGGAAVNVGNPHVIFFVDNNENFEIQKIGPVIEHHSLFPEKCNVTLATIVNKELIKVKVWERGAGLTKACGTAACATAFAAMKNGLSSNKVDIEFSTGKLSIFIDENNSIHMKGPVSDITNIEINI